MAFIGDLFSLSGKVAVITGGTGVLGSVMAKGLASSGAKVGVLGRRKDQAESVVAAIEAAGGEAIALPADVLNRDQLEAVRATVLDRWGRIDILVNAAGGNAPAATIMPDGSFFSAPSEALSGVFALNFTGTLLPSQVFGATMADQKSGCIVNISSMAADRALTRVVAYGAAKAAVENFTRWLAVEMAIKYGEGLRVNAIAPGFFIAEQNRALLLDASGGLTARGESIIRHTPARRFGNAEDLLGALIWLCSPGAAFITGTVIPVDGGFRAFSGV